MFVPKKNKKLKLRGDENSKNCERNVILLLEGACETSRLQLSLDEPFQHQDGLTSACELEATIAKGSMPRTACKEGQG